jgi:hypothetical protein
LINYPFEISKRDVIIVVLRFGVAFERNLAEEEKGLLLAATLLMEYMYYDM